MQQDRLLTALSFVEIRRGHDDGDILSQEAFQQPPELLAREWIDAQRRLVEEQHTWLVNQDAAQRQLLLHPTGELDGAPVQRAIELAELQKLGGATRELRPAYAVQLAKEGQVLRNREAAVQRESLGHVADPFTKRSADRAHVEPSHQCRARGRLEEAREKLYQRGLTGTIRSDHRQHLAGRESERHILERGRTAVPLAEPGRLDPLGRAFSQCWTVRRPYERTPAGGSGKARADCAQDISGH